MDTFSYYWRDDGDNKKLCVLLHFMKDEILFIITRSGSADNIQRVQTWRKWREESLSYIYSLSNMNTYTTIEIAGILQII